MLDSSVNRARHGVAAGGARHAAFAGTLWTAAEPVEPVHDYNIPIKPFRHPPAKEYFRQIRRQRKPQENGHDPEPRTPEEDRGVDDYA